jgi:hypothetical protein
LRAAAKFPSSSARLPDSSTQGSSAARHSIWSTGSVAPLHAIPGRKAWKL